MYVELAHHVEANCNEDMTTFLLSGFQPVSNTKAAPQPLSPPTNVSAVPGPVTGQMKIKFDSAPQAISHELNYGAVPTGGGTPANWSRADPKQKGGGQRADSGDLYMFHLP
jgi:hypothetical protein